MSDIAVEQQSTTKGFAILSMAGLVVKVLSLFYAPLLRRVLGDAGIGIYSYAYNIYVFLYVITNSGIPVAISKNISELIAVGNYRDAVRSFKIARRLLFFIGGVLSLFMFIYAKGLSEFIGSPSSRLAVMSLAPTLLVTSILSTYRGYFQGRGNMTPTAVSQVFEQIFNILFSLAFAYYLNLLFGLEAGVAGGTIGTFVGALVAVCILIFYYKKNKKIKMPKVGNLNVKRQSSKKLLKNIIAYSLPMTICIAMQNAGLIIDGKIAKFRLLDIGYNVRTANIMWGWIYQYTTLIGVPIIIIMSLAAAILPAISSAAALKDRKALNSNVNYAFKLCFLLSIPSAFGFLVLSEPICMLLGYSSHAATLLSIGAFNLILMSVLQIQTSILQGIGKIYLVTFYSVLGLLGKIVVNYIFIGIPFIGIKGILLGNFVCFLIPIILSAKAIRKSLRVKFNLLRKSKKIFFASAVMGLVVYLSYYILHTLSIMVFGRGYLINAVATFISIIVGAFIYLYVLILTGGIRKRDLNIFPAKVVRMIPKFMIQDLVE
ncbi:polysaccharide biosynthesis protein [Hathewaya histolytica]|uniref:Stage V sporulation protein B n=1 Tax=Hathewaya histolytica TaxID=1498 RepID=A0A4U9R8S7_HATHI|nr:polysaccharide biosynthesis protein [Hathewaya histolytica]VTQ87111.1 stage V sporulation protein B [Hathewaya histolytica]